MLERLKVLAEEAVSNCLAVLLSSLVAAAPSPDKPAANQ